MYRVQQQQPATNNNDYKTFSPTSQIGSRTTSLQQSPHQQLHLPLYNSSGYFHQTAAEQIQLHLGSSGQSGRNLCVSDGVQLMSDYLPNVDFMGNSHGHHHQQLQSASTQHSTQLQQNPAGYNHLSSMGTGVSRDSHHHNHHLPIGHNPAISATSADSAGLLVGLDSNFVVKELHFSEW
jgi:hypothetical protein